jgi:protein JSN1
MGHLFYKAYVIRKISGVCGRQQLSPHLLHHLLPPLLTTTATTTMERQSRLLSGGLLNVFSPSIFSSSWLPNSISSGNGYSFLDELRSASSTDLSDDFKVPTLDYLGLDYNHRPLSAATLSELRNQAAQAQAAIAGNLANPSRMCASTVSDPYRSRTVVPLYLTGNQFEFRSHRRWDTILGTP